MWGGGGRGGRGGKAAAGDPPWISVLDCSFKMDVFLSEITSMSDVVGIMEGDLGRSRGIEEMLPTVGVSRFSPSARALAAPKFCAAQTRDEKPS